MSRTVPISTLPLPGDFRDWLLLAFRTFRDRQPPEPQLPMLAEIDIREAISILKKSRPALTHRRLCIRLGMTESQLLRLQSHGRPVSRELFDRLRTVALDYDIPRLAEYFERQRDLLLSGKTKRGKSE